MMKNMLGKHNTKRKTTNNSYASTRTAARQQAPIAMQRYPCANAQTDRHTHTQVMLHALTCVNNKNQNLHIVSISLPCSVRSILEPEVSLYSLKRHHHHQAFYVYGRACMCECACCCMRAFFVSFLFWSSLRATRSSYRRHMVRKEQKIYRYEMSGQRTTNKTLEE